MAIYWNNHHHVLQAARTVDGRVLWANLLLLFFLSLIPFGTAWMGEGSVPIALVAPLLAFAIYVLVAAIWIAPDPRIERALKDS